MSVEPILPNKVADNLKLRQVIQSEIRSQPTQQDSLDVSDIALTLSPIALIFSWVVFFLILQKIRTVLDHKMVFSIKSLHQVPCRNCRFYSNNHYLKCAVEPSLVLTEQAKDCSEYAPKNGKFSPKNPLK
ncbi:MULTISPECIES: hypothetical protein [unclassified Anabaena]|uniref:hypothetical protein n=1 Tax=unclassified Anabaena TaxID=2619674 RepID=UPI0039C73D3B